MSRERSRRSPAARVIRTLSVGDGGPAVCEATTDTGASGPVWSREHRDRIAAAVINAGLQCTVGGVVARVAADRSSTPSDDLALAMAALGVVGRVRGSDLQGVWFLGELHLDGGLGLAAHAPQVLHVATTARLVVVPCGLDVPAGWAAPAVVNVADLRAAVDAVARGPHRGRA